MRSRVREERFHSRVAKLAYFCKRAHTSQTTTRKLSSSGCYVDCALRHLVFTSALTEAHVSLSAAHHAHPPHTCLCACWLSQPRPPPLPASRPSTARRCTHTYTQTHARSNRPRSNSTVRPRTPERVVPRLMPPMHRPLMLDHDVRRLRVSPHPAAQPTHRPSNARRPASAPARRGRTRMRAHICAPPPPPSSLTSLSPGGGGARAG
jgi:hypothetical protein